MKTSTILISCTILLAFLVASSSQENVLTCPLIGVGVCSPVRDLCRSNADCTAPGKLCCPSITTCGNDCVDGVLIPSMEDFMAQFEIEKKKRLEQNRA